jgi:hypothetical protein
MEPMSETLEDGGVRRLSGASEAFVVPIPGIPLVGMPYPDDQVQWEVLSRAGIEVVFDLTERRLSYDCLPLDRLSIPLQDLVGGGLPDDPDEQRRRIRAAVEAILSARSALKGAVVHCEGGRGRTGTVIGACLVRMGYPSRTVINWLNRLHQERGRPGWPESPWQSQVIEEFQ